MSEDEPVPYEVESRVSPPPAHCPHCDSLLPDDLGILECVTCSAQVKVEHFPTREAWMKEKVTCPSCRHVLVAGVDTRPADIRCSKCKHEFTLSKKIIKVEIECPACDRSLRITQRPGKRKLRCPACMEIFQISF